MDSLTHLLAHHGDYANFRDLMVQTSESRFGALWWGVWSQHVHPPDDAPPRVLVDLGTGPGLLLPRLRERYPSARLVGIEIQPEMLITARTVAAECGAELVESDLATGVPLPDRTVDVITAVMVVHELPYPVPLLSDALRALRPGGVLVLYDWVRRPLADYLGDEELTEDRLAHFREHCLFAGEDLEFLARYAGFEIIERVDRQGGLFSIIVARRPA